MQPGGTECAIIKIYSLLIGAAATVIAKFVHSRWNVAHLLLFGLMVFAVTFILTLVIKRA